MQCLCSDTTLTPCPVHDADSVARLVASSHANAEDLDFTSLKSMRSLDLSRNGLVQPLPPARFFDSGTSLRSLTYSCNRLLSIDALGMLPGVRVLRLSFNCLTSIAPLLELAPNVEQLWLDHNDLRDLVACAHTLSQLKELKHLVLFPNRGFNDEESELGWNFCASALPRLHTLDGQRLAAFKRRRSQNEILKTGLWRSWCRLTSAGGGRLGRRDGARRGGGKRGKRDGALKKLGGAVPVVAAAAATAAAAAETAAPTAAQGQGPADLPRSEEEPATEERLEGTPVAEATATLGRKKTKKMKTTTRSQRKRRGKENAPAAGEAKQSKLMRAVGAVGKWNKRMSLSELLQAL